MGHLKLKIREDINFLKKPNWVVSKRKDLKKIIIDDEFGSYELATTSQFGLPSRLDKIILYFLKYKLLDKNSDYHKIETTRHEVATHVFTDSDNFSQNRYARILTALDKWQAVTLIFSGSFYEKDTYVDKKFSIIDEFTITPKKNLLITFNEAYVKQIKETQFYKIVNFYECKNLTTPVSLRLYEIILKNLTENVIFYVDIKKLADKLTIQKKDYESQILAAIEAAVEQINQHTNLKITFCYEKNLSLCIFKKA